MCEPLSIRAAVSRYLNVIKVQVADVSKEDAWDVIRRDTVITS